MSNAQGDTPRDYTPRGPAKIIRFCWRGSVWKALALACSVCAEQGGQHAGGQRLSVAHTRRSLRDLLSRGFGGGRAGGG